MLRINRLPLRYRIYSYFHHLFFRLSFIQLVDKHPFVIAKNYVNRLAFRHLLIEERQEIIFTKEHFAIKVPLNDQAAATTIFEGVYDIEGTRVINALIRDCSYFIDVGANLGYFSLLACVRFSSSLSVIAIEPNPVLCNLIQESAVINDFRRLYVLQAAAGAAHGTAHFVWNPRLSSTARVMSAVQKGSIPIKVVSVDSILDQHGLSGIGFIKVDVEGNEIEVLNGSQSALLEGAIFLCEIGKNSVPELNTILRRYGYVPVDCQGNPGIPKRIGGKQRTDLILIPRQRTEWVQDSLKRGRQQ